MASANTNLRVTELDFDQIKTNLKNYLKAQSEFSDFDFDGSGMSVLLDILAYNTHYMGMYLNFVSNEMFLDTAQLRSSIMSLAKLTNYIPTSMRGAKATVSVLVTPEGGESTAPSSLLLPKYTRFFTAPIEGTSYSFLNTQSHIAYKGINNTYAFNNIELIQGEEVTQTYTVTQENTKRRFLIPSANIDTSTLIVSIKESDVDNTTTVYTYAGDFNDIKANSTVYFIEENSESNGTYTIYFGDGYIGKRPVNNNVVQLTYLDTSGPYANKAQEFTAVDGVNGYTANVDVTTIFAASGGSEKETTEEIRYRAPIYYTTQNRAVTKEDYAALIQKDYPYIESVSVWGGDENEPPVYGKIFVSLKPRENYELSLIEKERIVDEIIRSRSVMTVTPEIIDPDYTYLKVNVRVNYNPNLTTKSQAQLIEDVKNTIVAYRNNDLKRFDSTFRKSKLQRLIDNTDVSIISSSVDILVQKQFLPTPFIPTNYTFNFNMPLSKGDFTTKFFAYPTFSVFDVEGIERVAFMEEVPLSYTGVDTISVTNAGNGYTTTPTVTITGDGTGATATASIINGKISSITVTNRGSDYTTASATITGGGGAGATAKVNLQFRNGVLRTFYGKPTGEKVIINPDVGSIDYEKGVIKLNSFTPLYMTPNPYYAPFVLTLNIPPEEDVIYPIRNRILDINADDASSITVTMVAEQ